MPKDPAYGRRDFLKDSVLSVAKAAQEFRQQKNAVVPQAPPPHRTDWLRPPGAVEESAFLERCTKCSDCIEACPPGAIIPSAIDGTPVLFADQSPCVLCEDLPCIAACATEALMPVDHIGDVRMGIAVIMDRLCTAGQGCHACVSKCPTDALAMDVESLRLVLSPESCVGCGMCESVCKAVNDHVAIRIRPARQLAHMDQ
jgi:ferredoxin-type protein NapG